MAALLLYFAPTVAVLSLALWLFRFLSAPADVDPSLAEAVVARSGASLTRDQTLFNHQNGLIYLTPTRLVWRAQRGSTMFGQTGKPEDQLWLRDVMRCQVGRHSGHPLVIETINSVWWIYFQDYLGWLRGEGPRRENWRAEIIKLARLAP